MRSQFSYVLQNPNCYRGLYFVILGRNNKFSYPRIGLIVSSKYLKKSYQRNYIKRLIRESFRVHKNFLFFMDFVVIYKAKLINFKENFLKKELQRIWFLLYIRK
ncbi:MAG: RNase P protein component [Candidatus Westeberhardia cardiocondylae]|nr:RNase P protein component [Candidatus Westeberhardia cardiocondylae]